VAEKRELRMDNNTNITMHVASMDDIPILVTHHHKMFKEIWTLRGLEIDAHQFKEMDKAHTKKLNEELLNGSCIAWLVKKEDKIVASGAISINSMVPKPEDPSYRVAHLHSVFTEYDHRKNGFASLITKNAIHHCKSRGINRMNLGASAAGRPIYEKIGFQPSVSSMQLSIE
jgi:GNAT superfamily N-acetyltransferase